MIQEFFIYMMGPDLWPIGCVFLFAWSFIVTLYFFVKIFNHKVFHDN